MPSQRTRAASIPGPYRRLSIIGMVISIGVAVLAEKFLAEGTSKIVFLAAGVLAFFVGLYFFILRTR